MGNMVSVDRSFFLFHTADVESAKLPCDCRVSDRKLEQVKNY